MNPVNPYNGTKEEEIETLKLVFRLDGSNLYKDDAYNMNGFHKFKPTWRHNGTQYHTYLATLYDEAMETMDRYVAINDMLQHMISPKHVRVSTEERYMYSPGRCLRKLHCLWLPDLRLVRSLGQGCYGCYGERRSDVHWILEVFVGDEWVVMICGSPR
jgi:hypothetical protein